MRLLPLIFLDCASRPNNVCRNYYLLIAFFALATLYSFLDIQRQQIHQKGQKSAGTATVNGLGYTVITLFHINLTVSQLHFVSAAC